VHERDKPNEHQTVRCLCPTQSVILVLQLNGKQQDLFPTGKHPEPSITKLSDSTFALGKDTQSIFMNTKGDPIQKYAVKWSDVPIGMGKLAVSVVAISHI
jgi:hypothetical protein